MAAEKKQEAKAEESQQKPQEVKKAPIKTQIKAKPPASGLMGALITWFLITFLTLIFMSLLVVIVILFDFLGIVKLRDFMPPAVLENPYVRDYLRESTIIKSSEESKIKALIHEQESAYHDMADKLKYKEISIEEKTVKLSLWEKELRDRELDIISKEKDLAKKAKDFEETKKQKVVSDESTGQFAKMYERMDPQLAADALAMLDDNQLFEIVSKMKDKKSAAIMEKLPPEKVSKVTALIKKFAQENQKPENQPGATEPGTTSETPPSNAGTTENAVK